MLSKRPSQEIEETIIKQGYFIKSPPSYLFNKRTSWKGRSIKLCKTMVDSYYIRYYASEGGLEEWKGDITVSDIKSIQIGSNKMDKIVPITRLFNNNPENVLCIKTNKRDYYLVDAEKEYIADWHKCITDVWVNFNQKEIADGPKITHPALVTTPPEPTQGEAARPKSYPEEHPHTVLLNIEERQRSLTDPETHRRLLHAAKEQLEELSFKDSVGTLELELPKVALERKRSQTNSEAKSPARNPRKNRRLSWQDRIESRSPSEDTAYNSDSPPIYDTPKSMTKSKHLSLESTEEGEYSDTDSSDEDVYEEMSSVAQNFTDLKKNTTDPTGQTQNLPDDPELLWTQEQNDCCPTKPPRYSRITESNRNPKAQGSQLKKAYILKMMYEQDSLDYVRKHLTIPTVHLQEYLGLQEIGERLCVSKWKGPVDIGCVFCHGDHIEEMNGFRPESKEFFLQMLNHAVKDEMNLVVIRCKKAGIFHVEGCSCGSS